MILRRFPTLLCIALLAATTSGLRAEYAPNDDWDAEWIGVIGASKPNTWVCFRKQFELSDTPSSVEARIACDSKYWLWINDELVVFEGQLKRGPTPRDTYFDRVDLSGHLRAGENTVAILVCHFGRHGFSHNSSGKAGLIFEADLGERVLASDESWRAKVHPAFGETDPPLDNVRPPEANLRFDARHDIGRWQSSDYDDSAWGPAMAFGKPPVAPWNNLYERLIPLWKDSGLVPYVSFPELPTEGSGEAFVCKLPYNAQVTPYLKVEAPAGKVIGIHTDVLAIYGKIRQVETHRHEYVTRDGVQEFELPSWINGHEVHYVIPEGVRVLDLKYRETSYDTQIAGSFECSDPKLNQLWEESKRTLLVTMRDTYMDCPDRERAQWWGDAVNELGEAFYVFETDRAPLLAKKGIYELARWQRADNTLYSPVPSGIRRDGLLYPLDGSWDEELPRQMLASVGWYGFWTYYWYTADEETIRDVYPAVKKYLDIWRLGDDGLAIHRAGGWDWTDWGEHRDVPVIENAWLHLALRAAIEMARLAGAEEDIAGYQAKSDSIAAAFNERFWRNGEYRSEGYQGETDDRANAMAVVAGFAAPEYFPEIAEVLSREKHASPYMEKYVLEALMMIDRPELAFKRMRERYHYMLEDDKTTLWEFFDPYVLDGYGSLGRGTYNHAWSGGPLTILSQYAAGVAPTAPGFAAYEVTPQLGDLEWLKSATPTPYGTIRVDARKQDEETLSFAIDSPSGAAGVLCLRPLRGLTVKRLLVNGELVNADSEPAESAGAQTVLEEQDATIRLRLAPGITNVEAAYAAPE